MENLLHVLPSVTRRLKRARLQLFLDFDGTLAPIAATPSEAVLPARTRAVLTELKERGRCLVAVVSGRPLEDLKGKVGIEGLVYGANHGLEIEGPGIGFYAPVPAEARRALLVVKSALGRLALTIRGVILEDKGVGLSVHFRMADETGELKVREAVIPAVTPFLDCLKLREGKKVFDITPLSWDKGRAVRWLLGSLDQGRSGRAVPLYIGDDATDEDAFATVGRRGITAVVGENRSSAARYYLASTEEVCKLLEALLAL